MNIQERRNTNKRKSLHLWKKRFKINDIINRNNSYEHEKKKIELAFEMAYEGNEVFVEAPLIDEGVADIYVSDIDKIFEIRDSETDKLTEAKRKKYPCEIEVIDIERD